MTETEAGAYDRFSPYYDLMVADRQPHIEFFSSLLEPGQASLADIACGTGKVTAALAARLREMNDGKPVRVVGVDGSAGMLAEAGRHYPEIEWVQSDIRDIRIAGGFDLVISVYNSLQHVNLADLGRTFTAIRRITAPGGRLAFDIYKPNLPYLRQVQKNRLARTVFTATGERLEIREDTEFSESDSCLLLAWRLISPENPDAAPLAETSYRLWQHNPADVERLLRDAGFRIIERFGDIDRQPYGEAAKKQVIVCRAV